MIVLAILAPVATAQLQTATERAILQGAALVLDAQIDPLQKLKLAPALLDQVDVDGPRAGLTRNVEAKRGRASPPTPRSTTGSPAAWTTSWWARSRTRSGPRT